MPPNFFGVFRVFRGPNSGASSFSSPFVCFVYFVVTMPFTYARTVHFPDTDAAGVVFFPNYLSICHEAYEEALAAANVRHGAVRVLCPVVLLPSRRAQGGSLGGQNPL